MPQVSQETLPTPPSVPRLGEQASHTFSRCTVTTLPSSMSHELSSTFTSLYNSPSMIAGCPLSPTRRCRRWMSTTTSFPFSRKLTRKGTANWTKHRHSGVVTRGCQDPRLTPLAPDTTYIQLRQGLGPAIIGQVSSIA